MIYVMLNHDLTHEEIICCRICNSNDLYLVIDLGNQPLANALISDPDNAEGAAPLRLIRCDNCAAIQLSINVDPKILFSNYVWVTGTSKSSIDHCAWLAGEINNLIHVEQNQILEIASNDGTLLKELQKFSKNTLGVDPAENIAEMAARDGVRTLPVFFTADSAVDIVKNEGLFDVVIARNVFSHIPDPIGILNGMASCLDKNGIAVIEFHRADVILNELHYDSIYHEHTLYQSIDSMCRLATNAGLVAFDIKPSPISGGSWILFLRHKGNNLFISSQLENAIAAEIESGVLTKNSWTNFSLKVEKHRNQLTLEIAERVKQGKKVIAFGASARSSTILNATNIDSEQIACIADNNPLKQNSFSPGKNIKIKSVAEALDEKPDVILLLAFNFRNEIELSLRNEFNWAGELIVPFPGEIECVKFK
jgi:SAM-dependent methyltransferase